MYILTGFSKFIVFDPLLKVVLLLYLKKLNFVISLRLS